MECGKGRPVKIITDNSVEIVVFGNTGIPHPCNHTVSQGSVAGPSSIYINLRQKINLQINIKYEKNVLFRVSLMRVLEGN